MSSQESLLNADVHGLSVTTACLFIVGEIAGTGILALPEALKSTGWTGLLAIVLVGISFAFAGILLGKCWLIVEERDETLRTTKVRNAFSLIGERAGGYLWEKVTTVSLIIQMFGGAVVVMLILSETVERLFKEVSLSLTFCNWIIIIGAVLLPFTFLGSPVDFWPVAVSAMSSTAIAAVFLLIEIVRQNSHSHKDEGHTTTAELTSTTQMDFMKMALDATPKTPGSPDDFVVTGKTYILGLSTMAFAFAGASAMPTFQQDMRDKSKFTLAAAIGFTLLLVIYMPVSIVGYFYYGNDVQESVVRNMDRSALTIMIDMLMAVHIFSAFLIIINPVNLWLEHVFHIDHSFNFPRCFSRTVVHGVIIVVGLSIPRFGKLLSLVGASCVSLQSVILPCIFYYKLQTAPESRTELNKAMKILLGSLVVVYTLLAVGGTYYSLVAIFSASSFTEPCWISNCDKD